MTLKQILKSHFRKNNSEITHTKIKSEKHKVSGGSYTILENDLLPFHKEYFKTVITKGEVEHLTEYQQKECGPICIDFDFRYDSNVNTRQHSDADIELYCGLILDELKRYTICDKKFTIFIFEKDTVNICKDDNITKDGVHILIGVNVKKEVCTFLRNGFLENIKKHTTLPLINSWDKVYDEGVANKSTPWQLYGSCKPGYKTYKLKHMFEVLYDKEMDEFDSDPQPVPENNNMSFELFQKLSVQYTGNPKLENTDLTNKLIESNISKPKKKLNMTIKNVNMNDILQIKNEMELNLKIDEMFDSLEPHDFHIKECHMYTLILPEKYYESGSYNKWIQVAMALHATDQRLFITWIKLSSKAKDFSFDNIEDLKSRWDSLSPHSLTRKSIRYWAQIDAPPEEFEKVKKISISYEIEKSIDPCKEVTDHDIAKVIQCLYKDKYICVSIKKNIWFEFINHKWCEIEAGTTLRKKLSDEVHHLYYLHLRELTDKFGIDDEGLDELVTKKNQTKIKNLTTICTKLRNTQPKNNIMREVQELFFDHIFEDKLNTNPLLLCFENGVFDFTQNIFRDGRCEDYITKCTKIKYLPINDCDKSIIDEINDFMTKLFPVDELRNYMWSHLASTLRGTNENQTFNMYIGSGRNGKSKLVELMTQCLGDYKGTLPITAVTGARAKTGQVSPELVQLQGVRYAVMQEPSKGDKIVEGPLKEMTGGDNIVCRGLYKDSITFVPQFKLVVCLNTLLDVPSNDDGTWRRIRVCEFMAKFKEKEKIDDDPEEPYQFEVDKKLDVKFPNWKEVFMSMLIERVKDTQGNVEDCDIVLSKSGEYRSSQDYLEGYVKERIEKSDDTKFVIWSDLQEDFKDWYIQLYGSKVPRGQELKDYMNKKFGKPQRILDGEKRKQGWIGISICLDECEDNF
tara:strand:+ start:5982 stop:8714 length:2733 start_codon:yes stop_codon:yes gene_type:complete